MKAAIELGRQSLIVNPSPSQVPGEHSIRLTDSHMGKDWLTRVTERIARDIAADFLDDGRTGILFEYFPQVLEEIKQEYSINDDWVGCINGKPIHNSRDQ